MNENYPYRFKTKDELIREFGLKWRHCDSDYPYIPEQMDYILGQVLLLTKEYLEQNNYSVAYASNGYRWSVVKYMITENKPIEPNYIPKSKIERTI